MIKSKSKQYIQNHRASWKDYNITHERYIELKQAAQSGQYQDIVKEAAYMANKDIAEYIILSVMESKTYEEVEYAEHLGRIPCGRTDFYGYRRRFYHILDENSLF
ncbi:MAG: hypothetical protein J1F42_01750 [Lachnospiraceae bacterium]|nr:hypothetical protein [Lachnospiraceae bacterium]